MYIWKVLLWQLYIIHKNEIVMLTLLVKYLFLWPKVNVALSVLSLSYDGDGKNSKTRES